MPESVAIYPWRTVQFEVLPVGGVKTPIIGKPRPRIPAREPHGYSMSDHMRTERVADSLDMAVVARGGHIIGVMFHGDRGSQYISDAYRGQLANLGVLQSVGRTSVCWDHAVAEAL